MKLKKSLKRLKYKKLPIGSFLFYSSNLVPHFSQYSALPLFWVLHTGHFFKPWPSCCFAPQCSQYSAPLAITLPHFSHRFLFAVPIDLLPSRTLFQLFIRLNENINIKIPKLIINTPTINATTEITYFAQWLMRKMAYTPPKIDPPPSATSRMDITTNKNLPYRFSLYPNISLLPFYKSIYPLY